MIKTKTLFILGAGASRPFGYLTGIELREAIRRGDHNQDIVQALSPTHDRNNHDLLESVSEFINQFSTSSVFSIDSFLEQRDEFMQIGKMAIASYLIRNEIDDNLRKSANNWYMYLFNRLDGSFEHFEDNNISFITFNYDRSLEQFLFEALKSKFGKNDKECAEKFKKIEIVHLYGQLDPLPWQNQDKGYVYNYSGGMHNIERIKNAVLNIKLVKDEADIEKSTEFRRAHSLIKNAQIIYFIGFSFDPTNLERLNVELMNGKAIRGSVFGLETTKQNWVGNYFERKNNNIGLVDEDALGLLRKYLDYE